MIRQGAILARGPDDVLEALAERIDPAPYSGSDISEPSADGPAPPAEPANSSRQKLLTALGPTPVEIDELIRFTGEPARIVYILLLELELAGRLERHAGQRVSLLF